MRHLRIFAGAMAALSFSLAFLGCPNHAAPTAINPEVEPGTVGDLPEPLKNASELAKTLDASNERVILFYYANGVTYSEKAVYNWISSGDETKNVLFEKNTSYNMAYADFTQNASSLSDEMQAALASKTDFNFIIKPKTVGNWSGQTGDMVFPLSSTNHAMYYEGDVYPISENMSATISGASMETLTTMKVTLGVKLGLETSASSNGFSLKSEDGGTVAVSDVLNYSSQDDRSKNYASTLLIKLANPIDVSKTYTLSHKSFGSRTVSTASIVSVALESFRYSGDDLGLTLKNGSASFKVWAPLASEVKLLLYSDVTDVGNFKAETVAAKSIGSTTEKELLGKPAQTLPMTQDKSTGIWSYTLDNAGAYKYYKYQIVNSGTTYYVCDIYAKAASPDSIAAQITDINSDANAQPSTGKEKFDGTKENYRNPFTGSTYTEAVIYEMHIRDWSCAVNGESTGKFEEFSDNEIIEHLKDLGITHVQILPMFDYAQTNADTSYNWGYNPYHYNVPEGRYVKDMKDGTDAVKQAREMVQKLHDAGIAVIMDVVFNHTSGTHGGSLYDSTVPYYYYRIKSNGEYSNGSGCGNETNSGAPMFKKYMIDCLRHWMIDYHINGFRFDLMGLHEAETMKEIYDALYEIDKNVMVYGEPWAGGDSLVKNGVKGAGAGSSGNGYGAFDDDFRDAIKGAEFGGFNTGHIQGTFNDSGIQSGLKGKSGNNNRNTTGKTGLALHYAECHDNFTLYDKLVYSLKPDEAKAADAHGEVATVFPAGVSEEYLEAIRQQEKLAAAYIFLAQGTPFINGGQEFMRTKKGNPDSYASDTKGGKFWSETEINECNTVNIGLKETYSDVYNTYKALISLRKSDSAFTNGKSVSTKKLSEGVTFYSTKGETATYEVYFNATDKDFQLTSETQGTKINIDEDTGKCGPNESVSTVKEIPAKSFVILKK